MLSQETVLFDRERVNFSLALCRSEPHVDRIDWGLFGLLSVVVAGVWLAVGLAASIGCLFGVVHPVSITIVKIDETNQLKRNACFESER